MPPRSAGDVISDALSWSTSVRMGGISYGRDFSLRPDLVTATARVFRRGGRPDLGRSLY